MNGIHFSGGGTSPPESKENPTAATSSGPDYIAKLLAPVTGKKDGDKVSLSVDHGGEQKAGPAQKVGKWIVYGLAAFGAWKMGVGKIVKTAGNTIFNRGGAAAVSNGAKEGAKKEGEKLATTA
jgi:hypothetical protein